MKTIGAASAGIAVLFSAPLAAAQGGGGSLSRSYKPVRGFATSVCTNGDDCATQGGIFNIVLRNDQATHDERTLIINGLFQGRLTTMPNACGAVGAQHVLTTRDRTSNITTGPDVGRLTGGGDFVNTVEIREILRVDTGTGVYANLVPGGTVTLTGTLGLKAGINRFKVTSMPDDGICFGQSG